MGFIIPLIWLGIMVAMVVGIYKTFSKMGYDNAWWIFVPILQMVFLIQFLDKPLWWIVLFFVPFVNIYVAWLIAEKVATSYGKGTGFAVGLMLLGWIFYPILGLGSGQPTQQA